jgi:hypothetical protein
VSELKFAPEAYMRLTEWALCGNTGVSSTAMARLAFGINTECSDFWIPSDSSDFRRCHGLVEDVPEIREAFPLITERFPMFGPILDAWDELSNLLLTDPSACHRRLKELHPECFKCAGMTQTSPGTWRKP